MEFFGRVSVVPVKSHGHAPDGFSATKDTQQNCDQFSETRLYKGDLFDFNHYLSNLAAHRQGYSVNQPFIWETL